MLKRTTNLDSFWGGGKAGFWANKLFDADHGVYRDIANAGTRQVAIRECRYDTIGFRPVLEPKEPTTFRPGRVLSLEGHHFGLRQETVPEVNTDTVSFQPVLYPLLKSSSIQLVDCQVL